MRSEGAVTVARMRWALSEISDPGSERLLTVAGVSHHVIPVRGVVLQETNRAYSTLYDCDISPTTVVNGTQDKLRQQRPERDVLHNLDNESLVEQH